jgi:hypothetical protein
VAVQVRASSAMLVREALDPPETLTSWPNRVIV